MADIQRISHTHEAVLNWLIINPERSLRECADHFGYTQPWLSTLIHSDIFQMALRERQQNVANRVAQSVPERLQAVADIALDKLATMVEASEDPEYILDASDRVLHRMGYAPASARNPAGSPSQGLVQNTQNNVFLLGAADLAEARKIMALSSGGSSGGSSGVQGIGGSAPAIEGVSVDVTPEA